MLRGVGTRVMEYVYQENMYMRRLARGSKGRVGRRGGEEWRSEQVRTKGTDI